MKKYTLKNLIDEHLPESDESHMTQSQLQELISRSQSTIVLEEEDGYMLFKYIGIKMALFVDPKFNRMRIVSPITEYSSLAPKIKDSLMSANFHSTLDVRYGVSEDTLYSCFMHSLTSLQEDDLKSALQQLYKLNTTFGTTFSSAQIAFTKKK